jgi:hypothetical protein
MINLAFVGPHRSRPCTNILIRIDHACGVGLGGPQEKDVSCLRCLFGWAVELVQNNDHQWQAFPTATTGCSDGEKSRLVKQTKRHSPISSYYSHSGGDRQLSKSVQIDEDCHLEQQLLHLSAVLASTRRADMSKGLASLKTVIGAMWSSDSLVPFCSRPKVTGMSSGKTETSKGR